MEREPQRSTPEGYLSDEEIERIKFEVQHYLDTHDTAKIITFFRQEKNDPRVIRAFCLEMGEAFKRGDSAPFIEIALIIEKLL